MAFVGKPSAEAAFVGKKAEEDSIAVDWACSVRYQVWILWNYLIPSASRLPLKAYLEMFRFLLFSSDSREPDRISPKWFSDCR